MEEEKPVEIWEMIKNGSDYKNHHARNSSAFQQGE
jgi:hypothetical protein